MDSLSEAHHDAQRHGEREAGLWSKLSSVVACLLKAVAGPGRRFPMCALLHRPQDVHVCVWAGYLFWASGVGLWLSPLGLRPSCRPTGPILTLSSSNNVVQPPGTSWGSGA